MISEVHAFRYCYGVIDFDVEMASLGAWLSYRPALFGDHAPDRTVGRERQLLGGRAGGIKMAIQAGMAQFG